MAATLPTPSKTPLMETNPSFETTMHLSVPAGNPVRSVDVDQFCPAQTATRLTAIDPALVKLPTTLLSGLSPRTDARRNIVEVPPVIPEIFQGRQFSVAVGKAQVDGPRQSLFDIDLSDRTVCGEAP